MKIKSKSNYNVYVKSLFALICALVVLIALSRTVQAQDVRTPAAIAKLQKFIHLTVGSSTLEQIAAQLTQQTGLTIETAPYLRQHQITVQCDGATAQALLETFAELNDWQWQERSGRIVIERKLGRKPRSILDIPATVQSALAKDVRRYLLDGAENTITPEESGRRIPAGNTIAGKQIRADLQEKAVSKFCRIRGSKGDEYAIARLAKTLKTEYPDNRRLPWKKMTDWQQRLFVADRVLSALSGMHRRGGYQVLHGRIEPIYVSLQGMQIEFSGTDSISLMQNTLEGKVESGIGIGAQLHPEWLPIDLEQH